MNHDLNAIWARWHEPAGKPEPQELQRAAEAVEELYVSSGREKPAIVWCESFYQTLMLPSLIFAILHSDLWQIMSDQLLQLGDADEESWWRSWDEVFPEIWNNCGEPIFKGLNATSRVHEYKHLKDSMVDQLRRELGRNLHQDRLKAVHATLKREIYRKFWISPLHEVGREIYSETIDNAMSEAGQEPIGEIKGVIPEFNETVRTAGEFAVAIDENLQALCLRFGAEPALQGSDTFWTAGMFMYSLFEHFGRTESGAGFKRLESVACPWLDVVRTCSGILMLDGLAFLCVKPLTFHMDEVLHLHCDSGPAITYSDGFAQYAWHGVFVSADVVERPESITVSQIENEENVEVRRVLLERFGDARFLEQSGMTPVHEDEFGTLYKREFSGDEPLTIVKVVNASPEPDGSFKQYYLRVPPEIETARQAVAWSFGFGDQLDYHPAVQT